MAKRKMSFNVNKAEIDVEGMKIIENTKEGMLIYNLMDILKEFEGKDNLTISISHDVNIEPDETEY